MAWEEINKKLGKSLPLGIALVGVGITIALSNRGGAQKFGIFLIVGGATVLEAYS
ncbi:hypothetical protein [Actinocrinis sp.]|uniref:hypothetical protein n=1 Tax=Actinocrinis sp. TaxID=1920516 RepID=UPI002DDD7AD1|nr:hypothetical protein [Actinocrinis sp.]